MSNPFFDHPILNSPYDYPARHWELDKAGQPTQKIVESRRRVCRRQGRRARCSSICRRRPSSWRGSGYREGVLFRWTLSDFPLMDPIECGIVKLPRLPITDNTVADRMPMFRKLLELIRQDLPKKGRGKAGGPDPHKLPTPLLTALEALHGHSASTFEEWRKAGVGVPRASSSSATTPRHRSWCTTTSPADVLGMPFDFDAEPVVARRRTLPRRCVWPPCGRIATRSRSASRACRANASNCRRTASRPSSMRDSRFVLTPERVGATSTRQSGIIGEQVDLTLVHTGDVRLSTMIFEPAKHLVPEKWREPGAAPQLHVFGQPKRCVRQWFDEAASSRAAARTRHS